MQQLPPRPRTSTRRALLAGAGASLAALGLAGCGLVGPPAPPPTPPADRKDGLGLVLANSELVVGRNRFAVGILDESNRPIVDAPVTFSFFQIAGEQGTKRAELPATFRWVDQKTRGIYTASVELDAPGRWGVEAVVDRDGRAQSVRSLFEVKAAGSAPTIGSPAVRSRTPTVADVADPSAICTAGPPCELHTASLDGVLAGGKPSVVLFASPGFCSSATCAPQLGVLLEVRPRYADKASFVHVEIYKDPRNRVVADSVTEWRLPSEPWLFFVDRGGTIVERFDGIATAEEIEAALRQLV